MKMKALIKENEDLREQNLKLIFENNKLKRDLGKVCTNNHMYHVRLYVQCGGRDSLMYLNGVIL